jgi:threonine/homoserine/homoserine lactone efflux protein
MNNTADTSRELLDHDICVHIFTASAAMVGVCLTVIGIIRMVVSLRHTDVLGDDLLAVNAMAYLGACLMSYWALRTRSQGRNHRLERIADVLFLGALILTAVNAGFIAWAVSSFH